MVSWTPVQFRREFNNAGIGIVEMLFRCNILAIVGGGAAPRFPPNKARPEPDAGLLFFACRGIPASCKCWTVRSSNLRGYACLKLT